MFVESMMLVCTLLVGEAPLWLSSACPTGPTNWSRFMVGARPSTLIEDHRIETVESVGDAIDDLVALWPWTMVVTPLPYTGEMFVGGEGPTYTFATYSECLAAGHTKVSGFKLLVGGGLYQTRALTFRCELDQLNIENE
jgi:hypothetical protein